MSGGIYEPFSVLPLKNKIDEIIREKELLTAENQKLKQFSGDALVELEKLKIKLQKMVNHINMVICELN